MHVPGTKRELVSLDDITLADIQAIRLILRGHSVVDWHRLNLTTHEDVEQFLRVNCYDAEKDEQRLRYVYDESVKYLEDNFNYHFPPELKRPESIVEPFLMASSSSEFQNLACIILKVMHILNHVEARELRYRLHVSEGLLYERAEEAVNRAVADLIALGAPITTYKSSRKPRDSLVTKLLAKKNTHASQVFDRLRFRIITRTPMDIIPVLAFLKDNLLPFNYVVPGESRNDILQFQHILEAVPRLRPLVHQLQYDFQLSEASRDRDMNRFSSDTFRMINFVVDLPLRVDDLVEDSNDPDLRRLGHVVFVLVEFQMFDEDTFRANQRGEASHDKYKERQKWTVIRRLAYGEEGLAGGPGTGLRTRQ